MAPAERPAVNWLREEIARGADEYDRTRLEYVERIEADRDRYGEALEEIRDMKDWDGFRMQMIAEEALRAR